MKRHTGISLMMLILTGCATTQYSLVAPGIVAIDELTVQAGTGWNLVPAAFTPSARRTAATWTQDGLLLDRMTIIPAVPDGEPLLIVRDESAALPVFRADMLPNEIEELVESTIVKLFGESQAVVNTSNLRPYRFGDNPGVMFDLEATLTDSPKFNGIVGAFIDNDRLFLMYYLGAVPHYYDKHKAEAEAIIKSALIREAASPAA
jgi:hypothetical protein